MNTAIRLFGESGFSGVSLDELAAVAGVRRTLILYYYNTKEELWRTAATQVAEAFNVKLADKLARARKRSENDDELFREMLSASLDAYLEEPDFPRFLVREGGVKSDRLDFLVENFGYASVTYKNEEFSRTIGTTILRDVMFAVLLSMAALGPLMEASLSHVAGRRRSGIHPMSTKTRRELIDILARFMTAAQNSPTPVTPAAARNKAG